MTVVPNSPPNTASVRESEPSEQTEPIVLPPARNTLELRLCRLVRRLQENDWTAFDEIYALTKKDVARTLFHLVGNRADIEDLIQEVYINLTKAIQTFRGDSQFRTFLYRVCTNVALMHLRWWRRKREDTTDALPDFLVSNDDPERSAEAKQATELVHRALDTMAAKKRVVFVLFELKGMTAEEISEVTGISFNTVRSRLHTARGEFTQALARIAMEKRA